MNIKIYIMAGVALLGAIYSFILFLSFVAGSTCAFDAVCPMLFGLPVCFYGCVGFLLIFALSIAYSWIHHKSLQCDILRILYWVALVGMLFALYFLIQELFVQECPPGKCHISFGYPSCLYGFLLFFLLFSLSRSLARK